MGLLLDRLKQIELGIVPPSLVSNQSDQPNSFETSQKYSKNQDETLNASNRKKYRRQTKFPDLSQIPPELSLRILKYLNATDLCLAACVWSSLANDDILWQSLCKSEWGYASIYEKIHYFRPCAATSQGQESSNLNMVKRISFRRIFLQLDEATLTFNADWKKGLEYLFRENLLEDNPMEIAKFINSTKKLNSGQKEKLFQENKAVLENVIFLHNYSNQFLPTALRRFFSKIEAPRERNSYLSFLLEKFSKRFCNCNPQLGLNEDTVYILCFSLILLSVDLTSPAVKNKMSKREFIKNTRNALPDLNPDFTGHLYDNIYLNGSISSDLVTVR